MHSMRPRRSAVAILAAGVLAFSAIAAPAATASDPASEMLAQEDQAQPDPTSPTAYAFGETLAGLEGDELETTFLAEIIDHHRAAIEMAQLELERGTDPDIRTHAENIISTQQAQIEQFTRWLDDWYGLTPDQAAERAPEEARNEMKQMGEETAQMMAELREVPAGDEFDEAFVMKIIPHHSAGIIEFLEPQSRAVHAELRVAASTGITNQQAEVADFRTWLSGRTDDE